MAYQAGSAFISIAPSFRGFQTKIAAETKNLRAIKVPVEYDLPTLPATAPGKPIKVPVKADLDSGSFDRDVRGKLAAALKSIPKRIGLEADASDAERAIASLRTQLETLSKSRIGIDISDDAALAEIAYIRGELNRLGASSSSVQVRSDIGSAVAELEAVQTAVDKLDGNKVHIPVDADTGAAEAKLSALDSRLTAMSGRQVLISVGLSLLPVAGPLAAVLGGGGAALAGIGAGVTAGVAGGAAVGIASIKQALDLQKKLTEASKGRVTALSSVRSAEASAASASASLSKAQLSAARSVGDAERSVTDARRNGSRAVLSATQSVSDARRNEAAVAVQGARQIAAAQANLVASQAAVRRSLEALHLAREQAKRDLEDLKEATGDDARTVEGAQINLIEAQRRLAQIQSTALPGNLELRKAQLDVADAVDAVSDAQRQQAKDAKDLAKAQKDGINGSAGVRAAQQQVSDAKRAAAQARAELSQARADAGRANADAARGVSRAEQNLAQARSDAARSVATAERNLARARTDGATQVANAQRQLATANARVAAAQDKVNLADKTRAGILGQMSPEQKKLIAGIAVLKKEWNGFLADVSKPVANAALAGIQAIGKALPALALFIKPVERALGNVFSAFGNAAGSKGFKTFAADFGAFSAAMIRDAGRGTANVAKGLGNLLRAFMPLSRSMSSGLVDLTKKFATWSSTLGQSNGFQSFIGYVRKEGPVVLSVLGSLVRVFGKIFEALAPLGALILTGLQHTLAFLASMSPKQLIAVAGGIGAVGIAIAIATGGATLLVPAIAAVAGGLVYAYKHSKPFHDNMRNLYRLLHDNLFPALVNAYQTILPAVQGAFRNVSNAVKRNRLLFQDLGTVLKGVGWVITHVLIPVMAWIYAHEFKLLGQGIAGIIDFFGRMDAQMHAVFGKGGSVRSVIGNAVADMGAKWAQLKELFAGPVRWILKNVIGKLASAVNFIGKKLGHKSPLIDLADTVIPDRVGGGRAMATGGVLPGFTPGRDVHRFVSPTAGRLDLSGGEAIMRPEWTRAVGGEKAVARMNAAARSGQAFAKGGVYWPTTGHRISTYAGHDGVDINGNGQDYGNPIFAWRSGRISYAGWGRGYGHGIFEKAPGYPEVVYGHGSAVYVRAGQQVRGGQLIGRVGSTGNSSGPHLHFGVPGGTYGQALGLLRGAGGGGGLGTLGNIVKGIAGAAVAGNPLLGLAFDAAGALEDRLSKISLAGVPGGSVGAGLASGALSTLGGLAQSFVGSLASKAGNAVGMLKGVGPSAASGVKQWASTARQALIDLGQSPSLLGAVLRRMNQESGGNARAVNLTDSNARAGHPSVGLMQVIRGTYNAYKPHPDRGPSMYGVSINPYSNIYAGLNYAAHRYPSIAYAMNKPGGYDSGGYLPPGLSTVYNGTSKPEPVFTSRQWDDIRQAGGKVAPSGDRAVLHIEHLHATDEARALYAARIEAQKANRMARL